MDWVDPARQSPSPDAPDLNLLQFEELLGGPKKLLHDVQTINERIETLENQVFLKLP